MLLTALKLTTLEIIILFGPVLILSVLMHIVAGSVEKKAYLLMGRKMYLLIFGWLGTSIHELGHATMCVIFGHKINKFVLFNPDPNTQTLGYVEHSYNPRNLIHVIGNFFIGIGPILLGSITIFLSSLYLLPESFLLHSPNLKINQEILLSLDELNAYAKATFTAFYNFLSDNLKSETQHYWRTYVFFYLLLCIGSSMTLSLADIKSAAKGFFVIVCFLFFLNVFLIYLDFDDLIQVFESFSELFSFLYTSMLIALMLNFLLSMVLTILIGIKNMIK